MWKVVYRWQVKQGAEMPWRRTTVLVKADSMAEAIDALALVQDGKIEIFSAEPIGRGEVWFIWESQE